MRRTSLAVQQFPCYVTAGGSGSIPHWRAKILCDQKKCIKPKFLKNLILWGVTSFTLSLLFLHTWPYSCFFPSVLKCFLPLRTHRFFSRFRNYLLLSKALPHHSAGLAFRVLPREPAGLQPVGSQRVGHSWGLSAHTRLSSIDRKLLWVRDCPKPHSASWLCDTVSVSITN